MDQKVYKPGLPGGQRHKKARHCRAFSSELAEIKAGAKQPANP